MFEAQVNGQLQQRLHWIVNTAAFLYPGLPLQTILGGITLQTILGGIIAL